MCLACVHPVSLDVDGLLALSLVNGYFHLKPFLQQLYLSNLQIHCQYYDMNV